MTDETTPAADESAAETPPTGLGPEYDIAPADTASIENAIDNATAEVGHVSSDEDLSTPADDQQVESE